MVDVNVCRSYDRTGCEILLVYRIIRKVNALGIYLAATFTCGISPFVLIFLPLARLRENIKAGQ